MHRIVSLIIIALLVVISVPSMALAQDDAALDAQPQAAPAAEQADTTESNAKETAQNDAADLQNKEITDDQLQSDADKKSRIVVKGQKKKREFSDKIVVIQRKPFMRKHRFELAPVMTMAFNDNLLFQPGVGVSMNFYILDWLSIGVAGAWLDWRATDKTFNGPNATYDDIIDATDALPLMSIVNAYVGGVVGFTPIYGKFALFNTAIIHWDLGLGIGGGLVSTRANDMLGGGMLVVTHRWFLAKWFSLNFEARGLIYYEDTGAKEEVFTHWEAVLGLGFWMPFDWTYKSSI